MIYTHGFTLAAKSFYHQIEALQGEARQVAWDLRGHGLSGSGEYSIEEAADDLMRIIKEETTGRVVLVGHSMGGMVNFNALRRMDEETRSRVCGIVAISTSMDEFSDEGIARILNTKSVEAVSKMDRSLFDRARNRIAGLIVPVLRLFVFKQESDDIDFHASMIKETPDEAIRGYYDDLRDHEEHFHIEIPGWIIVGEEDDVTPEKAITDDWPNAEVVCVPRAGHMVILEAPDTVTDIIRTALDPNHKTPLAGKTS